MSAAPRKATSWLAQHFEKLFLVLSLTALLVSALILVLRIGQGQRELTKAEWERPAQDSKRVEPTDLSLFEKELEPLKNPFQSMSYSNALLISEARVTCINPECMKPIPYYAKLCPFCAHEQPEIVAAEKRDGDLDGMPDVYEKEHGFDPLDPADALTDRDGDGFANAEEFQAGTNPLDPNDAPDPPAKLRLVTVKRIPFVLRFQGVQNLPQGPRYLLNLRSLERSYFAKLGEEVEGFTVKEFHPSGIEGKPTLVIEKDGEEISLVEGSKVVDKFDVVAALVLLIDKSTFKVRMRDQITLKGRNYNVIDIRQNTASIRDVETRKVYQIKKITDSERRKLLGKPETVRPMYPEGSPDSFLQQFSAPR